MGKKKPQKWSEKKLRSAIKAVVYNLLSQNKPVDMEAIRARYLGKAPQHAQFITNLALIYSNELESMARMNEFESLRLAYNSNSSFSPDLSSSNQSTSQTQDQCISPTTISQGLCTSIEALATTAQSNPIALHRPSGDSDGDARSSDVAALASDTDQINSVRLQDFKDHLIGDLREPLEVAQPGPSLELQQQFLSIDDDDEEEKSGDTLLTEHAVLVSPLLESRGYRLPSQYALLGKTATAGDAMPDRRIMLNTNIPFSAFVCGVQGSGKSHTTACMIENCSMTMPSLGILQKSVSTLVLQFDEYSSTMSSQPSEAAFLARLMPQYAQERPVPLRVLVSPTNFHSLKKMYSQIPSVEVRPFKIQSKHLNISMMLSLMSVSQGNEMPLYMAQVIRVLREMAMESGGYFNYGDFRARLDALKLSRSQTPFLHQRLDLLDSYLDVAGKSSGDYFVDGGVTILDLSCPFVDQSTACILFRIAIELFLNAHASRGKMIVADEAHKYMTDTPAAKVLTETFLTIIRQRRHLGVRTIISTQEPTISPRLIDLCSVTIIHRFTSPEWYKTIERHVPMDRKDSRQHSEQIPDGFHRIAGLRTGEAIVFAPSAELIGESGAVMDTKHRAFKMIMRKRVTWDGGKTIVCIR